MQADNNIVGYVDENIDNLMNEIERLPQSQPKFEQQPAIQQPTTQQPMQQDLMMMQDVTDARQLPGARLINVNIDDYGQTQTVLLFNGKTYPLTAFQPRVIQQIQDMTIPPPYHVPKPVQTLPPPQPKVSADQPLIDLTQEPEVSNTISEKKDVEEEVPKSMITPFLQGYNKSIIVLVLVLVFMNSTFDSLLINKLPFLANQYAMLVLKAVVLALLYHVIQNFVKN